jgi:hypothetical protein
VQDNFEIAFDSEAKRWIGDVVLLGLDPDNSGGDFSFGDHLLYLANMIRPKKQKKEEKDSKPEGEFSLRERESGSGLIYELSLPWAYLDKWRWKKGAPPPGTILGVNTLLIDDDGEGKNKDSGGASRGARKAMSLSPGFNFTRKRSPASMRNGAHPGAWADLILGE